METQPKIGKTTIAPQVLETIARLTTLAVPGVVRMAAPAGVRRLLRQNGVGIKVVGNAVHVNLYVVTEAHVNMLSVGRQIQAEVTRAIQDIVGMEVRAVDVHIEDVAYPSKET